uniref:Uncharacterized protein n=1 Tax=Ixodes ricinus TaxID=34613 RepID=A0A6B0UBP7_IXORI
MGRPDASSGMGATSFLSAAGFLRLGRGRAVGLVPGTSSEPSLLSLVFRRLRSFLDDLAADLSAPSGTALELGVEARLSGGVVLLGPTAVL